METFLATAILAANSGDSVGDAARNTSVVFAVRLFATSLALPYSTRLAVSNRFGAHILAFPNFEVIAVVAVGEILTPVVLRRLRKGRAALVAATRAMQICGIALLAVCSLALLPNAPDLFVLGLSGFVFGTVYFCVAASLYRSAIIGLRQNQEEEYLAAYLLVTGLGAPIGTLLWGHLLGVVPLEIFFLVLGVVAALVVPILLRHALRRAQSDLPTELDNQSIH